ncbi:hypothetical protein AYO38_07330 [bacterium SCGC AG-212-C10]|nr:hypothetical protein AYO38_07330 [bacterium SCGC AG-212-C10]
MLRPRLLFAAILVGVLAIACDGSQTPKAAPPADATGSPLTAIGAGLFGPPGLNASAYATGLAHASAFAFDGDGRLWVATADFEDTGADGVYLVSSAGASPEQIITGLHTPLGLAWVDGALYVASKERIEAYRGFANGAFASFETVVAFPEGVGEVNGLILGADGRLRVGISAPCDHCVPQSELSAAVLSFLPDGSVLRVEASGIRAPIAFAYYPGTDDLFMTMNHRDDLEDATPPDWLGLVRAGDDWGFPDCYGQPDAACDNAPKPVAALDPHAAVSGVAIVTGGLGDAAGKAALVAEWSFGDVMRIPLTQTSGGYSGSSEPFITGFDQPMPVTLTPDGALLVGDWGSGTIYRITSE